ncbi:hypothetical protein PR003_g4259 [Phytophthora rubi]|uniref:Ubiquitin-like protease family profile domain-containing protein n=1 Tax=Phytophthora rubi TaxID=129364 RepID=A0A6A4FMU3_9STRA|nr:hypothetical protein PR003_g4259 [Phytophthora rubi]
MSLIVKAKSQQEYDECYTFVRKELGVDGLSEDDDLPPFWVYFLENWHKCREMWCSYLRDNAVHLGNSTNNRLESSWQKIKTLVDRNVDIDETVTTLIWWAKVKQKDFTTAMTRVGQVFDPVHHTSAELRRIAQMFSKYAFDIVKQQYDVAVSPNLFYAVRQEGTNIYSVASAATTCRVDVSLWISHCMIGTTQKLPCRHLMYLRKQMRCQTLVPFGFLNDRWQYNSAAMLERFIQRDFDVSGYSEGIYERQTRKRPISQTEKYRVALTESKRIAEVISRYSPPQFQTIQHVVERFADLLSEGKLDDLERAITRISAYTEINATNGEDKPQSPAEEETQNPTDQLEDDVPVVQTTGGYAHYELDDDSNTLDIPPKKRNENGENGNDNENGEGDVDRGETQVALEEEESRAEDTNQILNPQPADITVIDDDSCSLALGGCEEDAEVTTSPFIPNSIRRKPVWSVASGLKRAGRQPYSVKQRKFKRRKNIERIKKLERVLKADLLSYHDWSQYASKFSILDDFPSAGQQPHLCVAVPAAQQSIGKRNASQCSSILPKEWVDKSLMLVQQCQEAYKSNGVVGEEAIMLKFEDGLVTLFPKLTGTYIRIMHLWHTYKKVHDDVSTCVQYVNVKDGEELTLLDFALPRELDDECMDSALDLICKDAKNQPDTPGTAVFSTHLMAMSNDAQRQTWLTEHETIISAKDKIVGAVWIDKNHWCALCLSLTSWTYTVMDPRNDTATINKVDQLFKNVFFPLLSHERRWRREVNREYQQMDGISCGILVLVFIESYLFQQYDAPSDIDYLRYRYMVKMLLTE